MGDGVQMSRARRVGSVRGGCKEPLASKLQNAHKHKDGEMPDRTRWREPDGMVGLEY